MTKSEIIIAKAFLKVEGASKTCFFLRMNNMEELIPSPIMQLNKKIQYPVCLVIIGRKKVKNETHTKK